MKISNPKTYALYLINRRWRTVSEMTQRLTQKKFTDQEVANTIKFLQDKNFLDDLRFAKAFIQDRIELRLQGKYVINRELHLKGVNEDIIEKAWVEIQEDNLIELDEVKIAADLIKKKLKTLSSFPDHQPLTTSQHRRLFSFLSRRGFSYDIIKKALAEFKKER